MIRFRFKGVQGLGSWGQDPEAYGFLDCSYLCRTWQAAPAWGLEVPQLSSGITAILRTFSIIPSTICIALKSRPLHIFSISPKPLKARIRTVPLFSYDYSGASDQPRLAESLGFTV